MMIMSVCPQRKEKPYVPTEDSSIYGGEAHLKMNISNLQRLHQCFFEYEQV